MYSNTSAIATLCESVRESVSAVRVREPLAALARFSIRFQDPRVVSGSPTHQRGTSIKYVCHIGVGVER